MAEIGRLRKDDRGRGLRRTPAPSPDPVTAEHSDPLLACADLGPPEEFSAGMTLFQQGRQPNVLWLIESGLVKTVRSERTMDALVSLRGPGWVMGLSPAYLNLSYSTAGITATRCILRSIQPATLKAELGVSTRLSGAILKRVLVQARRDEIQRAEMAVHPARTRLCLALMRLADLVSAPCRQGRIELVLPMTNTELAQFVGVSREHLGRLLTSWVKSGRIERRRGVLLLPAARWPAARAPMVIDK